MPTSRSEKLTRFDFDDAGILEFRHATAFDMIISENLPRFEKIIESARVNRDAWAEGAAAHA